MSFWKVQFNRRGTAFHIPCYHGVYTVLGVYPVWLFDQKHQPIWVQSIPKEAEYQHLGGYVFWNFWIWPIFWEIFRIWDFQYYNGAHCNIENLKSWISPKILAKAKNVRKHTPPNVAIPLLLVCFGPIWVDFSGKKVNFKIFSFSPIVKSMISLLN